MVRKCGYLPLAISLLGGVLSKKHCMKEWVMVNEDISSSIYRGEVDDGKGSSIEQVMNLSYQDLPYFLKPCFLFLARWREDEIIYAHQLYRMWITQGLITHESIQRKEKTLMEIAELYLSELVSRSIVLVDIIVADGSIPIGRYWSCKLHDAVRELCVSTGKSENFGVQILECGDGKISTLLHDSLLYIRTRHLVMHFEREVRLEGDDFAVASEENAKAGYELETVGWIDSSVHELASIVRMKNLHSFGAIIRDNGSLSTIINAIAKEWTKLQYFGVSIEQGCKLTTNKGKMMLKQLFACPHPYLLRIHVRLGKQLAEYGSDIIGSKLLHLVLQYCEIKDDPMLILGKLPTLKVLKFWLCSFVGEELTCPAYSFPRLKILEFCSLPNWKDWRVEEGAMPLLSELEIANCANFQKLPDGLSCISTLKKLMIFGMPELSIKIGKGFP